jgi:plastocyanin
MTRIPTRPLILLALLVLLLVACRSGNEQEGEKGKEVKLGNTTFADHGTKDVKGKSEVELEADSFYFSPTFLRGTPGHKLTLEVENESSDLHNLSLPAQAMDQDLPAKGKMTIAVTFPQSGTVWFFCKYHTSQGMNGELLAGDAKPAPVTAGSTVAPTTVPSRAPGYP